MKINKWHIYVSSSPLIYSTNSNSLIYFFTSSYLYCNIAVMQYKYSIFTSWSCLTLFLQYVQARVANPQDSLVQRDALGLENDETSGFLGKVQDYVLGKRQQICVYDAYLQALDDLRLATDLCGQIIGIPSVTVVVDSTPVMYKNHFTI